MKGVAIATPSDHHGGGVDAAIAITPQMLVEGAVHLYDSPFFEGPLSAAEDIVVQIFRGMIRASPDRPIPLSRPVY